MTQEDIKVQNTRIQNTKIQGQINNLIDEALNNQRKKESKPRNYLGASRLGVSCLRALQYEYSNIAKDINRGFTGKTLRIFAAGHVFEELIIKWLRLAGFTISTRDKNGNQHGFITAGGRVAGHVDGIITKAPKHITIKTPAILEVKSLNGKSWREIQRNGLIIANPIYAAQIALYQAYINDNPCLFTAINKDTAEIYHELIPFDRVLAQNLSDKCVNILKATEMGELLPRISHSPEFLDCKLCSYQDRCWSKNNELNNNKLNNNK